MDTTRFLKQLTDINSEFEAMRARSGHDDLSDLPDYETQALVSKGVAAIERIAGARSAYSAEVQRILNKLPLLFQHLSSIMGVVKALHSEIANGHGESLIELAHADVFADFLEMAQHLLDAGYKDASAVIAGSSLEAHLRALCIKNSLPTEFSKSNGDVVSKKADMMNSDLVTAGAYQKLDQKGVAAWLDLRNKAAHGQYAEYQKPQVQLLVSGVLEFIRRNPA